MLERHFKTPLGDLFATADQEVLCSLSFGEKKHGKDECAVFDLLADELEAYFKGRLKQFTVPFQLEGTPFQKRVWKALLEIPYGAHLCYKALAESIENPNATRAVGSANGKNPLVILIPCHRVLKADGSIGGYSQGIERKQWLLDHEKMFR